jgi:hypothetical protein
MRRSLLAVLCALAVAGGGCLGKDTVTTTAPTTTTVTLPPLVDSHGLGFGFRLGAADQTAGLFVWFTDMMAAAEGSIPKVSVLPDSRWEVEVRIGSNLFSNWSQGLEPWVDEVWPVVAGRITFLEWPESGEECGYARALLEGFEAVATDGTRVHLGDFEVENTLWGCFAE